MTHGHIVNDVSSLIHFAGEVQHSSAHHKSFSMCKKRGTAAQVGRMDGPTLQGNHYFQHGIITSDQTRKSLEKISQFVQRRLLFLCMDAIFSEPWNRRQNLYDSSTAGCDFTVSERIFHK